MATKKGIEKRKQRENPDVQKAIDAAPSKNKLGMYLRVPEKVKRFDPKPDRNYRLIFLPWKAGKGNTTADEGRLATMLFLKVHMHVGVTEAAFLCEAQYGKTCHACTAMEEARRNLQRDDKEGWRKYVSPLKAKDRSVFLIHDLDGEPNNIQVWELANYCFADHLLEKFKSAQGESYRRFANYSNGLIINVRGKTQSLGTGGTFTSFSSIDKEDRPKGMAADLDKIFDIAEDLCVEKWLVHTPPDRVLDLLGLGESDVEDHDETEAEEVPTAEDETEEAEDDEEADEVEEEEEKPKRPVKKPSVKTPAARNGRVSKKPEPEEAEEDEAEEAEDEDEDEGEDLEEPEPEDEEEESEEETEDEPPMTKPRKPAAKPTPPVRRKK